MLVNAVNGATKEDGTYAEDAEIALNTIEQIDISKVKDKDIMKLRKDYIHFYEMIKQEGISRDDGIIASAGKWVFDAIDRGLSDTFTDYMNAWEDLSGNTTERWEHINKKYNIKVKDHGLISL